MGVLPQVQSAPLTVILAVAVAASTPWPAASTGPFDHEYGAYAQLLEAVVRGARVDYRALAARRPALDGVVRALGEARPDADPVWTEGQRFAFWINAYNVFTLKAIADRYPIRGRWLSRYPRNSIRQIEGVWTERRFRAAGRDVTLDDIEHRILRPTFADARLHFAINCASVSCPPVRQEPYVAARLDDQLADATRAFLASPLGLQVDEATLRVSRIFEWYGDDFTPAFAAIVPGGRPSRERGILGTLVSYGPPNVLDLARSPAARVRFLDYDWSLNDVER